MWCGREMAFESKRGGEGNSKHIATSRLSHAKHMSGVCHRKYYPGAAQSSVLGFRLGGPFLDFFEFIYF